ncbi:MAG TPA: hypothetical protein PKD09_15665 [Aggregatilinea sp.]|jgi:hypothetical protein|uniref:hypothetical protein n=1 Tax=Aggregatilinea sp. TaxID=2806333 RepID=UPI002B6D4BF9|nr:hypothetical protein [Aggregatilinea sp.]HML23091.1 hypothetical protein [Aggregatilinea sp.]
MLIATGFERVRTYGLLALVAVAAGLLAACTASQRKVITATPAPGVADAAASAVTPTLPPGEPTALESEIGSYADATALLDSVCYEFLASLAGTTWTWTSPDDLAAFYDRVDESEQCTGLVQRGTYEFGSQVLLGTVGAATGCDAAFRLLDATPGAASQAQRYVVELVVTSGCDYELLEPLVMAVPAPPGGSGVELGVITP